MEGQVYGFTAQLSLLIFSRPIRRSSYRTTASSSRSPTRGRLTPRLSYPGSCSSTPSSKDEPKALLTGIIKAADADVPSEVERGILTRLEDARQAAALTTLLERYNAGEVSITRTVVGLADSVPVSAEDMPEAEFDMTRCSMKNRTTGVPLALGCTNQAMRPSRTRGLRHPCCPRGPKAVLIHRACAQSLRPAGGQDIPRRGSQHHRAEQLRGLGSRLNQRLTQATLNMNMDEMVAARENRNLWNDVIDAWGGAG